MEGGLRRNNLAKSTPNYYKVPLSLLLGTPGFKILSTALNYCEKLSTKAKLTLYNFDNFPISIQGQL